ncbi:MAG TPA: PhzF family phenazine biosynthesis protein [Terriglobales bacterium]|nr:PhzF family phenazine biosynthesis protein [Terriglobales bacterium]
MRRYPFVQFDVFTSTPLEGNPLAVFPDGRGLSDGEMQALAREMNLSETTFLLPRDPAIERERGVRMRIFTPEEELPFAGHPTLGTAYYLHRQSGAAEVRLEVNAGTIPVTFRSGEDGVFGEMRQNDPVFGMLHPREPIAHVAGLAVDDLDASLPIQTVSTGLIFAIVPVRSRAALEGMHFDLHRAAEYLEKTDAKFLYFVSRDVRNPRRVWRPA